MIDTLLSYAGYAALGLLLLIAIDKLCDGS